MKLSLSSFLWMKNNLRMICLAPLELVVSPSPAYHYLVFIVLVQNSFTNYYFPFLTLSGKHFQFGSRTFGPPETPTEDFSISSFIREFQDAFFSVKKTLKLSALIDHLLLFDGNLNICQPVVNYHNMQENHKVFKDLLEFCEDSRNNNLGTKSWEIDIVSYLVSYDLRAIDGNHVWEPVRSVHDNSHLHVDGKPIFATLNRFEDMVEFENMSENRMLHYDISHYFGFMDGLHRIGALLKKKDVLSDKLKNADIVVNFHGARRGYALPDFICFGSCQKYSRCIMSMNKAFIEENIHDQIVQVWNSVDKLKSGDGLTDSVTTNSIHESFRTSILTGMKTVFASSQNNTVSRNKVLLEDLRVIAEDFRGLTKQLASKAHIISYFTLSRKPTDSQEFDDLLPLTCIFCLILAVYVHKDVGEKIKSNLQKLGKDFRPTHICK